VWSEVMTPIRDAVHLIDDKKTDAPRESRQHRLHEPVISKTFGRNYQNVTGVPVERGFCSVPFISIRAIDCERADADSRCRLDLIAHQRQQRADENGGSGALVAKQLC